MGKTQKYTGRAVSLPVGLSMGTSISVLITGLIIAISAHLISTQKIAQEHIGYCAVFALLAGSILGALVASGKVKHRLMVVCILNGMAFYSVLLMVTALFFGGRYQGVGVTLVVVFLGSVAAALIQNWTTLKRQTHKRKKTHR